MIPRRYIEEWKEHAHWPNDAQVEQDLVIERALVELFSDDLIREHLAFRGGTALHKLFLKPQVRYSEDIDLVQIKSGAIKPALKQIGTRMKFLGTKRSVRQNVNNNTIMYRFESEIPPIIKLKLKIEINCQEHFSVLGLKEFPFAVNNSWFSGSCNLTTYELDELLGTKLRALYQRKKGRDLFDIYWAAKHHDISNDNIIRCFKQYMEFVVNKVPTKKQFALNLSEKETDKEFNGDIYSLLRPGIKYDRGEAFGFVREEIVEKL